MSDEQLDEYRQLMQQRYNRGTSANDEQTAKRLQEEENCQLDERIKRDEEIARKLQEQYSPEPPQPQQAAPPQHRPTPMNYPPANQPLLGNNRPDGRTGCLPRVDDKCCGINAQICVLSTAAILTIGIFVSLVMLVVG